MSVKGGDEWGPAVRRSTAPRRPGLLRRVVHSQPEEGKSNIVPAPSTGNAGFGLKSFQEREVVRPSSASAVVDAGEVSSSTCPYNRNDETNSTASATITTNNKRLGERERKCRSTDESSSSPRPGPSRMVTVSQLDQRGEGPNPELKLTLMKNAPVSLLEMKSSCRLNIDRCVDLQLNFEKMSSEDMNKLKMGKGPSTATSRPGHPVVKLSAKQKSYMDREIRKKMGEQRLLVDATDDSDEVHQLEGRRQVVNNSFGRYFVIGRTSDGGFAAHPVKDWMLLEPCVKYKTLNSDEADVEFEKRDKTLNHFSIMVQKRLRTKDESDDEEKRPSLKRSFRRKADSWISSESGKESSQDDGKSCAISSKGKSVRRSKRPCKKKKYGSDYMEEDDDDETSCFNSDHENQSTGEFESESEEEDEAYEQKGVDEEEGLKDMLESEEEEDNETSQEAHFQITKDLRNRAIAGDLTEEKLRKYLLRKPFSAVELVQKFKSKGKQCGLSKEEVAQVIAHYMSVINPVKLVANGVNLFYIPSKADQNSLYLSMVDKQKLQ